MRRADRLGVERTRGLVLRLRFVMAFLQGAQMAEAFVQIADAQVVLGQHTLRMREAFDEQAVGAFVLVTPTLTSRRLAR